MAAGEVGREGGPAPPPLLRSDRRGPPRPRSSTRHLEDVRSRDGPHHRSRPCLIGPRPVRPRLASLRLSPEREREILDELSQHLDERYEELRAGGATDAEARRLAIDELREPDALAAQMRSLRQARVPPPIAPANRRAVCSAISGRTCATRRAVLRKQPGFTTAAVADARAGHRRKHRDLQPRQRHAASAPAGREPRAARLRVPRRRRWRVLVSDVRARCATAIRCSTGSRPGAASTPASAKATAAELVTGVIVTGNFFDVLGVRAAQAAAHGGGRRDAGRASGGGHQPRFLAEPLRRPTRHHRPRDPLERSSVHDRRRDACRHSLVPQLGSVRNLYVPMMMQAIMRPPRAGYSGEQNPDLLRTPDEQLAVRRGPAQAGIGLEHARAELEASASAYVRTLPQTLTPAQDCVAADRRGRSRSAAADAVGRVAARRRGRRRVADRLREHREPAALEGRIPAARAGGAARRSARAGAAWCGSC